jgi:uncharacterized protein
VTAEPVDLLPDLAGLGTALRDAGLVVGTGQQRAFAQAVARLDVLDRDDVYWAGRACLVNRGGDIPTYDRVFAHWAGEGLASLTLSGVPPTGRGADAGAGMALQRAASAAPVTTDRPPGRVASAVEALRHKDFAACSDDERAQLAHLLSRLALTVPRRRSRRHRRTPSGRRPDLRRALRDAVTEEARPPRLPRRQRRQRPRPVVLLLDVSGSMSAYSRLLLQFAWSSRRAAGSVEVFCFGTRLTRITTQLAGRNPDHALAEAAEAVVDWDGGTRIGDSVRQLLREHGRRSGCRGAVVVICSDGLERGDPQLLADQLARLKRLSHRVVWVNPLAGDPAFRPATRGMSAALPHVDALVAGHSLASLEALSRVMSDLA